MAEITYIVNKGIPDRSQGIETYKSEDEQLLEPILLNSTFENNKHIIELHILTLSNELIESDYDYRRYSILQGGQVGDGGATALYIDPVMDARDYGYEAGGIKLLYHYYNDVYSPSQTTTDFFIQEISPDRTELLLNNLNLSSEEINTLTLQIQSNLQSESYFNELRLNFKNNDLQIVTNIDVVQVGGDNRVAIKLYEPLPLEYGVKSVLNVVELVSDSVIYEVESIPVITQENPLYLRSANFNLDIADESIIPTQYLNYDELFSYQISNTNNEVFSLLSEKGAELSIDHTEFENFIHFSSAEERLLNFKYKVDLVNNYETEITAIQNSTPSEGTSGSISQFNNLIEGVVRNFDHYERYLYYESGSNSWPKSNTVKPYINKPSNDSEAIQWFADKRSTAALYDSQNPNQLLNTIPLYLRDDPSNENYSIFVNMISQHFDTLWIYAKAVTDKYDADNRLDKGISKDLVGEALKNFGVKLYTSNKSVEDLFSNFVGQGYVSGSEVINTYVTGSVTGSNTPIHPSSYDNYQKEINKRIYHNLSYLLKTKGTERGLRALINCFGIPSDILTIKLYGGRDRESTPFFGNTYYSTSSLDKIRLDNTGSMISGSTLSEYTSITKRDYKYTDDLHGVEIGFSPSTDIDNYILSEITSSFNIDQYIGDPRLLHEGSYEDLGMFTQNLIQDLTQYDIKDYVRLIKFFDNVIFKTVKDFLPARASKSTGIVIKPHILSRSKVKSPAESGTFEYLEGLISIGSQTGSHGSSFGARDTYSTSYSQSVQTPGGIRFTDRFNHQESKYSGEFSGSLVEVSDGELNRNNPAKFILPGSSLYDVLFISGSDEVCLLAPRQPAPLTKFWVQPGVTYQLGTFFSGPLPSGTVSSSVDGTIIEDNITNPHIFTTSNYSNYDNITLMITSSNVIDCQQAVELLFATCSLRINPDRQGNVLVPGDSVSFLNSTDSIFLNPNNQAAIQRQVNINNEGFNNTTFNTYPIPELATGDTVSFRIFDINIHAIGGVCQAVRNYSINVACNLDIVGQSPRPYLTSGNQVTYTLENLFINTPTDVEYLIQTATIAGEFTNIDNAPSSASGFSGNEYPVDGTTQITLTREVPPGGQVTWSWTITSPEFPFIPSAYLYPSNFDLVTQVKIIARSAEDSPSCQREVIFTRPQETEIPVYTQCEVICVPDGFGGFITQYANIGVAVQCFGVAVGESCTP